MPLSCASNKAKLGIILTLPFSHFLAKGLTMGFFNLVQTTWICRGFPVSLPWGDGLSLSLLIMAPSITPHSWGPASLNLMFLQRKFWLSKTANKWPSLAIFLTLRVKDDPDRAGFLERKQPRSKAISGCGAGSLCLTVYFSSVTNSCRWHFPCLCGRGWRGGSCQHAAIQREIQLSQFVKTSLFFPLSFPIKSSRFGSLLLKKRLMTSLFSTGVRMLKDRTHLFALRPIPRVNPESLPFFFCLWQQSQPSWFYGKSPAWYTSLLSSLYPS